MPALTRGAGGELRSVLAARGAVVSGRRDDMIVVDRRRLLAQVRGILSSRDDEAGAWESRFQDVDA